MKSQVDPQMPQRISHTTRAFILVCIYLTHRPRSGRDEISPALQCWVKRHKQIEARETGDRRIGANPWASAVRFADSESKQLLLPSDESLGYCRPSATRTTSIRDAASSA